MQGAMILRAALGLCLLAGACMGEIGDPSEDSVEADLSSGVHHGVWVYGVADLLGTKSGRDALVAFTARDHISEVYLAITDTVLADAHLPGLIQTLHGRGVKVEALMGDPSWGSASGRPAMLDAIGKIVDFNDHAATGSAQRFRGIHLDIEPFIGVGEDLGWVTPLTHSYEAAASALVGAGLTLAADVAGSKIRRATAAQRQEMLDAVDRLVLMQYETTLDNVEAHTTDFLAGLTLDGSHGVVVAIRAEDFPSVITTAAKIEADLGKTHGYAGYAIFEYQRAAAQ
jgi:hypothetical protein